MSAKQCKSREVIRLLDSSCWTRALLIGTANCTLEQAHSGYVQ